MANPDPNQSGIASWRFTKLPPGYRNTRALRVGLPEAMADRYDLMSKDERSRVVLLGFQALEQREAEGGQDAQS